MTRKIKHIRRIVLIGITFTIFLTGLHVYSAHALDVSIEQVDTVSFPKVKVHVKVIDEKNNPIPGLTETNFSVQDNSTPITDFQVSRGFDDDKGMQLIILVDTSDNWRKDGFKRAKEALGSLINSIAPEDQVSVFTLGETKPQILQSFESPSQKIEKSLQNLVESEKNKAVYDAIYYVLNDKEVKNAPAKPDGRKQMLVVSSGKTEGDGITSQQCIEAAQKNGVVINTVTFDAKEILKDLKNICVALNGQYLENPTSPKLAKWYQDAAKVKDRYILQFTVQDTGMEEHTLLIELKYQNTTRKAEEKQFKGVSEETRKKIEELFQKGATQHSTSKTKEDYAKAKAILEEVVKLAGGKHPDAESVIKKCEQEIRQIEINDKFEEAKKLFDAEGKKPFAQRDYEKNVAPKFQEVLAEDGNHSGANEYVQKCKEQANKQAEIKAIFAEGEKLFNDTKYAEAIAKFSEAISSDKTYTEAAEYIEKCNNKMKSSDSFEKGKRLYEERKYKEALTSFQEARDLDKENEEIQKWIDKTKAEIPKNEQLKAEYERGVELYSKGEYQKALEAFKEVEKLDPDYQDVKKRISDCEAIIPIAAAFDEAVKSFNTAEQTKEVEDYEKAKSKFQQIQKQMPTYQKDKVDDYISKCDAAISLRLYFQALELYSGGNYKEALEKLEKLQRSYPDYKKSEVENMIKDIRKGLKTPPKVTQPPPQVTSRDEYKDEFDAAVKAFIEKKYEDAKAKFDTLQKKDPNYRKAEVASYIAQCDEEIKRAIYDEAIQLYQNEKYAQAKARFEGLQKQYPDYKKDEVASWIKDCDDGDAKKLYGDAEKLYQEQNYAVAKTKFETLQKEYPDYKKEEVASWIKKCDEALKPKSNILLYVMIGSVGLLIMVGVLAFALTRQKTRYCPICGREMDPTWTQCLFCAQQAPQAGQQPSHAAIKPAIGSTPQIAQQSSGIPTTRLGVGGASVIVKEGERKGQEYRLEGNLINIGRDENANNVALNDSAASRMHAQIKFQGGRFVLSDLGGTNGTYVNGKQINTMQLEDGDEITIGRTVLLFKIGG